MGGGKPSAAPGSPATSSHPSARPLRGTVNAGGLGRGKGRRLKGESLMLHECDGSPIMPIAAYRLPWLPNQVFVLLRLRFVPRGGIDPKLTGSNRTRRTDCNRSSPGRRVRSRRPRHSNPFGHCPGKRSPCKSGSNRSSRNNRSSRATNVRISALSCGVSFRHVLHQPNAAPERNRADVRWSVARRPQARRCVGREACRAPR